VPEMPPTVMSAPVHPAGKRVGSMLMRLARTLVPSVRASPAAGKAARLGFSPAMRVSFASRVKPMHLPPEQLSPLVAALPSSHVNALLRCPQPTAGGVQKSVVHTFASSQVFGTLTHVPLKQVSATVQTLPSLHPDGHLGDGTRVEELDREVVGEGERKVRIGQDEVGATTDGVQAGLQGEPGRILVVLREPVNGIDWTEAEQRRRAQEGGRRRGRKSCQQ